MSQPLSLKGMYESESARYRDLNRMQYGLEPTDRALTPEEVKEQRELQVKARFHLFDPTANEDYLRDATRRYNQFRADPEFERKRDEFVYGTSRRERF